MNPVTIILDGTPGRREHAIKVINGLKLDDGEVWDVIIGRHIAKRTLPQNSRLWLLHTAAARHVGCTTARIHEDMLCEITGVKAEIRLPSGQIERVPNKRSSDMDKQEFRLFMDQVEAFYISELGVFLEG